MANILNEQYYDLNNWIKNINSFPVFENTYENGINTLQYQGAGDFERVYIPITVEQNHNYQFKFKFYSPTGFTIDNYGNNFAFAFVRNTEPSDTDSALSKTNLVYSQNWDNNATNISKQYTISFHSNSYTQLYIALDFGYILDGETKTYIFSNFELDDCSELMLGASCMPNMKDVNAVFDSRTGVNETSWQNLVGNIDFQLYNPIITTDGLEVIGSQNSYGKFSKPWVNGSSRTWYFIFKNTSGKYTNWKTIIGNEIPPYRCSTISMDGNGYIKFTRPDIIPSTSLGFRCSDWHVVAWVSNGSNSTTRLFIDGVYIGYTGNMQGWANDTYLCRGDGWWYDDNNTLFRAAIIADSAHSDTDVIMNSKWLYDTYITNYIKEKIVRKYLIQDNQNIIYTLSDNTLVSIDNENISKDMFLNYGMDNIPIWDNIKTLINPKILFWSDKLVPDNMLQLTAYMKAIGSIQTLITNPIDLNDSPNITGINQVTLDSDGDILIAVSFDEKNSWLIFNGTDWNITASDIEGMNKETLEAITSEQWTAALGDSKTIYFKAIFSNVDDALRKINIEFLMS